MHVIMTVIVFCFNLFYFGKSGQKKWWKDTAKFSTIHAGIAHPATIVAVDVNVINSAYNNSQRIVTLYNAITLSISDQVKGKGRALVIAPLARHCHRRGAQVHVAHQAASHIPALYLPSRSRYSFTDPERMEGWVSPGPSECKEQPAHGYYATARSQLQHNITYLFIVGWQNATEHEGENKTRWWDDEMRKVFSNCLYVFVCKQSCVCCH